MSVRFWKAMSILMSILTIIVVLMCQRMVNFYKDGVDEVAESANENIYGWRGPDGRAGDLVR